MTDAGSQLAAAVLPAAELRAASRGDVPGSPGIFGSALVRCRRRLARYARDVWWSLPALLAVAFVVSYQRDPRSMRCGVFLLGAVLLLVQQLVGAIIAVIGERDETAGAWALLLAVGLVALLAVVLGVVLVLNGLTMVRREGRRVANLLSLLAGLAVLVAVGLVLAVISTESLQFVVVILLASLPVGFLSFGFAAYLLYSALYQAIVRGSSREVDAVVVLGSGLIDGRVPPLLASRLDRGHEVFEAAVLAGRRPVLVASGGQGADEPRAEAAAMADYLVERGVPSGSVVTEDASRTTEENLANTARLLAGRGVTGEVAVVTNNFHAFRAALLMRRTGIPGHVLGSPTANYYWPSATIREYLAILRDHRWFVVIGLVVLALPLVVFLAAAAG